METKPYKTSDRGKAAYFITKGMICLGCIESGEAGRMFFVFNEDDNREQYEQEWGPDNDSYKLISAYKGLVKQLKAPVA